MISPMSSMRRVTVRLPAKLIQDAMDHSGKGPTDTIREALEEKLTTAAYDRMLALRGKIKFGMSWQEAAGKYDDD